MLQDIFQLFKRLMMTKKRTSLSALRKLSFTNQNGHCYYCNQPMWNSNQKEFSIKHSITIKQAKQLQCTGEHLIPHSLGGPATKKNIVAACAYCNRNRHKRENELSPTAYKSLVSSRLTKKRWHGLNLH